MDDLVTFPPTGQVLPEKPVIWTEELAPAAPFLMPSPDGEPIEILPTDIKPSQKLKWAEEVELCEIENRFQLEAMYGEQQDDDDNSYEIEIVEDDGDADFYLEIVDGEIFYVFETEDDMSSESESDDSDSNHSSSEESSIDNDSSRQPAQLSIADMLVPQLDFDNDLEVIPVTSGTVAQFNPSDSFVNFNVVDDDEMELEHGDSTSEQDESGSGEDDHVRFHVVPSTLTPMDSDEEDEEENQYPQISPLSSPTNEGSKSAAQATSNGVSPASIVPPLSKVKADESKRTIPASSSQGPAYLPPPPNETFNDENEDVTPVTSPVPPSKPKFGPSISPVSSSKGSVTSAISKTDGSSPVKSILKACPPSPISPKKKNKSSSSKHKDSSNKKEKTVTKRYVRADNFDGEQMVFSWEKPKWTDTDSALKKTDKGADVRKGANLASPITFPKKSKKSQQEHLVYADEKGNTIDKDELIRRIQQGDNAALAFVPLPTYGGKNQKKLRCSPLGEKMRRGADLAKPVTMATVNRERADINHLANKEVLKNKVQTVKRQYSWETPEWAQAQLKSASNDNGCGKSQETTAPSTSAKVIEVKKKEYTWAKPEWLKPNLSATKSGEVLKKGQDLQKPITHLPAKTAEAANAKAPDVLRGSTGEKR